MEITTEIIAKIRQETGYGMMDIKNALVEAGGDEAVALEVLKQKGLSRIEKRAERVAAQGVIEAYVHGGRIGVLLEVNSETDFVARGEDFKNFAHEVALHIASMAPANVAELLEQPFVKEPDKTVGDLLTTLASKTGEKIQIARFCRYELGQQSEDSGCDCGGNCQHED